MARPKTRQRTSREGLNNNHFTFTAVWCWLPLWALGRAKLQYIFGMINLACVIRSHSMLLCEAVILYMDRSSQAERKMACRGWDFIEKAPLVTPAPAAMKRRGLIDMDVHSLAQQNTHFDAQVCTHCGELTPPKDPVMMIGKKCFCSISSYNHSRPTLRTIGWKRIYKIVKLTHNSNFFIWATDTEISVKNGAWGPVDWVGRVLPEAKLKK